MDSIVFLLLFISSIILLITSVVLVLRTKKERDVLKFRESLDEKRRRQISLIKAIHENIAYELEVEKISQIIIEGVSGLISPSCASVLIIKKDKLLFNSKVLEKVSPQFINRIREDLVEASQTVSFHAAQTVEEQISGQPPDENSSSHPASSFNVPLVVDDGVWAIFNFSSSRPHAFPEEEIDIVFEITEHASNALTRLKEGIQREKERLTAMIASLSDGVFMLDTQDNLVIINKAGKSLLSLQEEDPTYFDIVNAVHESLDLPARLQAARTEKREIEEKEVKIKGRVLQVFITPVLRSAQGEVIGTSVLLHDITTEKNMEQMKEDFTNMMVHELRAPLTAVRDAAELLTSPNVKLSEKEKEQFIRIIHTQSKLLVGQVTSVLDAAKIESGKLTVQKSPGDLKKVIEEQVAMFSAVAEKRNILLETELDPSVPEKISFDPVRITQVINNLISNSLKFTNSSGKIKVSARMEADNKVSVRVSDNGVGIPKEKQSELFSRFSQLGKNPVERAMGTGLGLFIIKGIIEAHGGTVKLTSEEGKGTIVEFTLPVENTASHTEAQSSPPSYAVN